MAEFGIIKRFGIDNGELDGLSPQQCFVLGYELAEIDNLLKQPGEIRRPINAGNKERVEAACREANRWYSLTWMEGDSSEAWLLLVVHAIE